MTSHLHLIVSSKEKYDLVSTIRDFKKFTSKELVKLIKDVPESRDVSLLNKFAYEANRTKRGANFTVWKTGYHAKELTTNEMIDQKRDYIHNNPVEAGFVSDPEHWLYSSARNYAGEKGVIEVTLLG